METTVEKGTIIQKKRTKIFVDGKDTMSVLDIDELERHGSCTVHRILVTAGRTETAVTTEGHKFKTTAMRTAVHSTTKSRITAMDHLFDVFELGFSWVESIFNFFIII